MGPNEFTLQEDRVGLIDDGGDLHKFLTIDSKSEELSEQELERSAHF